MSHPEKTDITTTTTTTTTINLPDLATVKPTIEVSAIAFAILICILLASAAKFVHELRLFIEFILGKM